MNKAYHIIMLIIILVAIGGIIFISQKRSVTNNKSNSLPKEIYEAAGKAAFTCPLIANGNYSFVNNRLVISFNGNVDTFNFEKVKIVNELRPVNNQVF